MDARSFLQPHNHKSLMFPTLSNLWIFSRAQAFGQHGCAELRTACEHDQCFIACARIFAAFFVLSGAAEAKNCGIVERRTTQMHMRRRNHSPRYCKQHFIKFYGLGGSRSCACNELLAAAVFPALGMGTVGRRNQRAAVQESVAFR